MKTYLIIKAKARTEHNDWITVFVRNNKNVFLDKKCKLPIITSNISDLYVHWYYGYEKYTGYYRDGRFI